MQHSLEEEERAFQACAARGPARPRLLAAAPAALAEPAVHHRPAHRPSAGAHECPRRRRLVCGRSLALKYSETGEPSSLDQADQERLQMVESYLQANPAAEEPANGAAPGKDPARDAVERGAVAPLLEPRPMTARLMPPKPRLTTPTDPSARAPQQLGSMLWPQQLAQ